MCDLGKLTPVKVRKSTDFLDSSNPTPNRLTTEMQPRPVSKLYPIP
jgi:hypothetical protein